MLTAALCSHAHEQQRPGAKDLGTTTASQGVCGTAPQSIPALAWAPGYCHVSLNLEQLGEASLSYLR